MRTFCLLLTCLAIAASVSGLRADEFLSNGVKIHYEISGQGEPVILIHGLYASAELNWDLPRITSRLADHFRVIALDNRGHGRSDKPEGEDKYGVQMVEDIVRLMDHLQIQKAHIVGYSLGGMITLKLLTLHPERVSSAVLGGMGWLKEGSFNQRVWENLPGSNKSTTPPACVKAASKLAVTEKQVLAVHVPVDIIVGDNDPCRALYVEPLQRIRPDWPVHIIANAGHIACVTKMEFKDELEKALLQHAQ